MTTEQWIFCSEQKGFPRLYVCVHMFVCVQLCATSKHCTNWAISLFLAYILKRMAGRAAKHTLVRIRWRILKRSVDRLLGSAGLPLNLFGEI